MDRQTQGLGHLCARRAHCIGPSASRRPRRDGHGTSEKVARTRFAVHQVAQLVRLFLRVCQLLVSLVQRDLGTRCSPTARPQLVSSTIEPSEQLDRRYTVSSHALQGHGSTPWRDPHVSRRPSQQRARASSSTLAAKGTLHLARNMDNALVARSLYDTRQRRRHSSQAASGARVAHRPVDRLETAA